MVLILMYMPQAYALLLAGAGALGQQGSVVVGKIQVRSESLSQNGTVQEHEDAHTQQIDYKVAVNGPPQATGLDVSCSCPMVRLVAFGNAATAVQSTIQGETSWHKRLLR